MCGSSSLVQLGVKPCYGLRRWRSTMDMLVVSMGLHHSEGPAPGIAAHRIMRAACLGSRIVIKKHCRNAQHSLASSLLESNVFRINVGGFYCLFVKTLGISVCLTQHVQCHMLKFAGHRPATKRMHSVGLYRARQHISL